MARRWNHWHPAAAQPSCRLHRQLVFLKENIFVLNLPHFLYADAALHVMEVRLSCGVALFTINFVSLTFSLSVAAFLAALLQRD
jgi:hypothetical protein